MAFVDLQQISLSNKIDFINQHFFYTSEFVNCEFVLLFTIKFDFCSIIGVHLVSIVLAFDH